MKLKRVTVENFKGIKSLELDLCDADGSPRPLTCIIGDNGSGKTSILQAIAWVLGRAAGRIPQGGELGWPGFLPERVDSLGEPKVELVATLSRDELDLADHIFDGPHLLRGTVFDRVSHHVSWGESGELAGDRSTAEVRIQAGRHAIELPDRRSWFKLLSRRFAEDGRLSPSPDLRRYGSVFWFDQTRDLAHNAMGTSWTEGVGQLRELLVGWWAVHTSVRPPGERDLLGELQDRLSAVFPGLRFVGVSPRKGVEARTSRDFYILVEREGRTYDIAEMSSGEQAIFPMALAFVQQQIGNSVVLIDELELHLHPPQQQALLGALRKLGPDCQFIVTTHSPYLTDVIPDDWEIRLERGSRCL